MYILFLFIVILFLKGTKEEFNNSKRIEGAVKLLLSSLENNQNFHPNKSFTLKYPKYEIFFDNFKIISSAMDNINLYESRNSGIFSFKNITFDFVFDVNLKILSKNIIKKIDNFLDLEINFINFNYINKDDNLEFDSFGEINNPLNLIKTNFDFESLEYFYEFKERKACLCKINNEEYQLKEPHIFMFNFFQEMIKAYIKRIINKNILLTYDAFIIFNNTIKTIECSDETKNKYKIEYIKINKILIPSSEIKEQEYLKNKIFIYNIKFIGFYYSSLYKEEIHFTFELDQNTESPLYLLNRVMSYNLDNLYINCKFCDEHNKEFEALKFSVKKEYTKILNESIKNYYN
jgi:hypothetical protein